MVKDIRKQKGLVLLNILLLLIVTGILFTLYYPLEIDQGITLLICSTLFPLLYFWSLLFPIGRKHVKQLNIVFLIGLILWYCIGGLFYQTFSCYIFYILLAIYMIVKQVCMKKKIKLEKINKVFMGIVIVLAVFFGLKSWLDYYEILDTSVPIILFEIFHAVLMVGLSLHFTMDENHFLNYEEEAKKEKNEVKKKEIKKDVKKVEKKKKGVEKTKKTTKKGNKTKKK